MGSGDKNSSGLHAKTPDPSNEGTEFVCGIGERDGGDEAEGIRRLFHER